MVRSKCLWLAAGAVLLLACGPAATATPPATAAPSATATPIPAGTAVSTKATPTAAAAVTPTSAPSAGPLYGGLVRYPMREDPPTWDPALSHVDQLITAKTSVFSKLFMLWTDPPQNCKEATTPLLVKTWKWVDDTTVEMTLNQGIRFHNKAPVNGRELVADDVVFGMERYRNLPFMAGVSANVASTKAVDKYTFRMTTARPWGGLPLELMAHDYGLFPLAKESGGPNNELWTNPEKSWVGVGPFMFEKWTPGAKWRLARNPSYWRQGKPYVDAVEFLVMPDVSTEMAAIRSGVVTGTSRLAEPQMLDLLKQVPGLQAIYCPGSSAYPGVLYYNNSGPPFDNLKVRRAVAMAIDRQAIVNVIYLGRAANVAVLRQGLVYAMSRDEFPAEVRQYMEYNPEKAKALLAEAGYPNGLKTVINVTPRYAAPYMQINEMLAAMFTKVGIQTALNTLEYGRYSSTVLQAKYPVGEMATTPGLQQTPEDGHALRSPHSKLGGSTNRSLVTDPEYDRLYDEFAAARDEARRAELARQLQNRQIDQAYRVVLPYPEDPLVGPANLRGMNWRASARDWGFLLENLWYAK